MSEEVSNDAPEVVSETPENESVESNVAGDVSEVSDAISADPEAAQEIAEAVESGEITKAEAVEAIRKLTLKVDGQEIEKELPFDLPPEAKEWMQKELQLAAASNKRMQEAADLRKAQSKTDADLEKFINQLKDPNELDAILKHFGHDPAKFAEDVLNKEVEKMKKSPEQLELEELRAEVARRAEAEEKAKASAEEAKQRALEDKHADIFKRDLSAALDKYELPDNPQMVREMSSLMRVALKQGIDVSFDEVGQLVKEQNDANIKQVLKGLSADKLMEILKDNQINDIILKKTPKAKKEAPPTAKSVEESGVKKKEQPVSKKRTESADDFFRKMQLGQFN